MTTAYGYRQTSCSYLQMSGLRKKTVIANVQPLVAASKPNTDIQLAEGNFH